MRSMRTKTDGTSFPLRHGVVLGLVAAGILALSALADVSGAVAGERPLPPQELRQLFPGQFRAQVKGYDVRFVATRDGRIKGFYGGFTDEGRWSLRGNRLCIMLKDWLDGKTTCSAVHRSRGSSWYLARGIRFRRM